MENSPFEQKQYLAGRAEFVKKLERDIREFLENHAYYQEVHFRLVGLFNLRDELGYEGEEDIFDVNFEVPKGIEKKIGGRDPMWEKRLDVLGANYGVVLRLPHDFENLFIDPNA